MTKLIKQTYLHLLAQAAISDDSQEQTLFLEMATNLTQRAQDFPKSNEPDENVLVFDAYKPEPGCKLEAIKALCNFSNDLLLKQGKAAVESGSFVVCSMDEPGATDLYHKLLNFAEVRIVSISETHNLKRMLQFPR